MYFEYFLTFYANIYGPNRSLTSFVLIKHTVYSCMLKPLKNCLSHGILLYVTYNSDMQCIGVGA